ncbi:hypothetical protein PUN28_020240 [Cardiocondyla obscurior]|uniref:Uncharacterized protein n=1 Tax=Cardiocondyla obscurior TaxID=286306 RepID=A0AAW2EB69_9HYME
MLVTLVFQLSSDFRFSSWSLIENSQSKNLHYYSIKTYQFRNFIVTLGLCELRFLRYERDSVMCGNARVTGSHYDKNGIILMLKIKNKVKKLITYMGDVDVLYWLILSLGPLQKITCK